MKKTLKKITGFIFSELVISYLYIKSKGCVLIGKTTCIYCIPKLSAKKNGKIIIAPKCAIENCEIVAVNGGKFVVKECVAIGSGFLAVCHRSITIGKNCSIAPNVTIYDHDHIFNKNGIQPGYKVDEIKIGDNVWIGTGVIILKGTEIGDNSVIGAGAVIQGKIPNNSLVKCSRDITIRPIEWE